MEGSNFMEFISEKIFDASKQIVEVCTERGIKVSTAESCTGGFISQAITAVSGSSAVIELGVCSYSNRIKRQVLGVSADTLEKYSEYSAQCACEMADGAARISGSDYGVSTTGVAGPSGGSSDHPVGEVYIGIHTPEKTYAKRYVFDGDREKIRASAALRALEMLLESIN